MIDDKYLGLVPASRSRIKFGANFVSVALFERDFAWYLVVCRDEKWIDHLAQYLESGFEVGQIWWLVDKVQLVVPVSWPSFDSDRRPTQDMLEQLQVQLSQRSVVDRLFIIGRNVISSYAIRLPHNVTAAQNEMQQQFLKKSEVSSNYHFYTNLNRSKLNDDIFGEMRMNNAIAGTTEPPDSLDAVGSIRLPEIKSGQDIDANVFDVFTKRRSTRHYREAAMTQRELAALLKLGGGLREIKKSEQGKDVLFYHYPIGGGIKSTNLYCYCARVEGFKSGLYTYFPDNHSLIPVDLTLKLDELAVVSAHGEAILSSSVVLLITIDFYAKTFKYLDRAYRVLISEAGHLSQNLHLCATALSLKSCVIMDFDDEQTNKMLKFNGKQMAVISLLTVGK